MDSHIELDALTVFSVCESYLARRAQRRSEIEEKWKAKRTARLIGKRRYFGFGAKLTEAEISALVNRDFRNALSFRHGDRDLTIKMLSGWGTASKADDMVEATKNLPAKTKVYVSPRFWACVL